MMLFFLLVGSVWGQVCSPLNAVTGDAVPHHAIVFNDFEGKGGSEGTIFVGGNMRIDQFSAGSLLGVNSEFAIVVAGDIDFQCGDVHNNVLHGGAMTIGPRVSWEGYTNAQIEVSQVYEFASGHQYYQELSRLLINVQAERDGAVQRNSETLIIAGSFLDTEIFNLACADLSGATILEFSSIKQDDTTSIFINVRGEGCTFDAQINSVRGLRWAEPAGHILWNFEGTKLEVNGGIIGSVLAPNAHITGVGHILGQILVQSVNGTFYLGANLFRGCVPTDTCFLMTQACPDPVVPVDCIGPELIDDEENPCCKVFSCKDSCDEIECIDTLVCTGQYHKVKIADSLENGGFVLDESYQVDPCCELFACMPIDVDACTDQNSQTSTSDCEMPKPVVHSCPADIVVHITDVGVETTQVDWVPPTFLYTGIVTSNYEPNSVFSVGTTIVSYNAEGLFPDTSVSCYFAVHVNARPDASGCTFGGVNYEQGEWFFHECAHKCLCFNGQATRCTRIRKELLSMDRTERAHYWSVFKIVYADPDGVVQRYIVDHVTFFSRGLHNNGAFLPWHRGYILELEDRLRVYDCKVTVPYWDWTTNPRISTSNVFGEADHQASSTGHPRNRCVNTGTFGFENGFALTNGRCLMRRISGGSTATAASVEQQIFRRFTNPSQYDNMRNRLEHGPGLHDSVHCLVGGTMCSARSSNDPIFFSHHANIDQYWARWQELSDDHKFAYNGNTPIDQIMPVSRYTPRQMLDNNAMPSGVRISYFTEEKYSDQILQTFTDEELSNVGFPAMQPVGDEWLFDMNMASDDIAVIRAAEELANSNAVQEAIAVTLRNGVERGMQMPSFEQVVQVVTRRLASESGSELSPEKLFVSLTRTFRARHLVPRFYELQDIIVLDESGDTEDIVTDPVPVVCAPVDAPVCSDGRTFANECEATQNGFSNVVDGACLPDPVDVSLSPTVDGGVSDAYNHAMQELSECPDLAPSEGSVCPVELLTCYYGQECCNIFSLTATCTAGIWSFSLVDCALFNDDCSIPSPVEDEGDNIIVPPRPPTRAPTRAPTRPATRAPTTTTTGAPTDPTPRRPTRAPTRPTPRPTRPTTPRPRPTTPRPSPTTPIPTVPTTRPARPRFVPRHVPSRPVRVLTPTAPSPRPRPIVIPPPVCPVFDESACPPTPICCPEGAIVDRTYIANSMGVICGRGCETCMIGRRTVTVPECCRLPVPCAMISCAAPLVPQLVRPQGSNYGLPCCDQYECRLPCSNIVCPTLESRTCPFPFEVPRFSSRRTSDGCCFRIECVFGSCQSDERVCASGEVLLREATSDPPCVFPECPVVCDTSILYCPGPGGVQTQRERTDANAEPPCEWQPCPPYEPCDDESLNDPATGFKCGLFGECTRGFSTLNCECQDHYSGGRCQTFTEPPRPVFGVHERSFLLTSACIGYMCYNDRCSMSSDSGVSWVMLPVDLKAILGSFGEDVWFADSDGHAVLYNMDSETTSNPEQDAIIQQQMDSDGFVIPRTVFSQRFHEDGVFPPPSERDYIINYDTDLVEVDEACAVHVYLTNSAVVFYNAIYMHATSWGTELHCEAADRDVICGDITRTLMCENKCISEDGSEETCNDAGMCVRETGECLCNFGYTGEKCDVSTVISE